MKTSRTFEAGGRFNVVADAPRFPRAEPNVAADAIKPTGLKFVANAERDSLETARPVNLNPAAE